MSTAARTRVRAVNPPDAAEAAPLAAPGSVLVGATLGSLRAPPRCQRLPPDQIQGPSDVQHATHAANRPRAATATPTASCGNPRALQMNYRCVHRPASVLATTRAEDPPQSDALTREDEERIARVSRRLRAHLALRRVLAPEPDQAPVAGEFDA